MPLKQKLSKIKQTLLENRLENLEAKFTIAPGKSNQVFGSNQPTVINTTVLITNPTVCYS